jgi:hypothetical protein
MLLTPASDFFLLEVSRAREKRGKGEGTEGIYRHRQGRSSRPESTGLNSGKNFIVVSMSPEETAGEGR